MGDKVKISPGVDDLDKICADLGLPKRSRGGLLSWRGSVVQVFDYYKTGWDVRVEFPYEIDDDTFNFTDDELELVIPAQVARRTDDNERFTARR